MSRFALLSCALTSLAACATIAKLGDNGSRSHSAVGPHGEHHVVIDGRGYRVGPYWGPECTTDPVNAQANEIQHHRLEDHVIEKWVEDEPHPTMGKQPNLAHDPAAQVLRLVCVERIMAAENEPARNTWVMQHFRFDEVSFDHFTAALMLVQCLEAESCLNEGAPGPGEPKQIWQYYEVGMMRWYAEQVDPAAVATRLQSVRLDPAARAAFLQLLDRARARVIAVSDELATAAEIKHVFVDLPRDVYKQHAAARAKYAAIADRFQTAAGQLASERRGGAVADKTVADLRDVRAAYASACKADCSRTPLFVAMTRQLFWAYVARGESAAAMAEAKLMEHVDPTAAEEIATKQTAAIAKLAGRLTRVNRAREQGIDADTARSTAQGNQVFDLGDGRYVYQWASEFKIDWEALVPEAHELRAVDGIVTGIERRGDKLVIAFRDQVSSWSEGTGCYETGRIDSISSDGHINYREECSGEETHVDRTAVPPMTVPVGEGGGLRAGDQVVGFATPEEPGRIWFVKRGNRIVRLRELSL